MLNFCCVILLYTRVVLGQTLCSGEQQWCTIVDGPEVYEDRDPAQREAEGPKSSMDYSEFFISTKKNPDRPCPYSGGVKQRPLQSAAGTLLLRESAHITFMLWLYDDCCVNFGSQTICTTPSARCYDKDFLSNGQPTAHIFQAPACLKLDYNEK